MTKVVIYTKSWCPYCARAKDLLVRKGVAYEEVDVSNDLAREREMITWSGRHSVPQIFIDEAHIGGSDDLAELNATGRLDELLTGALQGETT